MRKYNKTRVCWANMKQRCDNPKHPQYKDYGGRGITYDPRWRYFKNFLEDMGEVPEGLTLDRFPDNNAGYHKNNCRWATRKEQRENCRKPESTLRSNPYKGVTWQKDKRSQFGGQWRAYADRVNNKQITLYTGPDVSIAIEARQFYEEFILGAHND